MDLLRHLRYFVAVAEELHFGRAADRLHIAQSPLSQRIRALERELGAELFVRTTRQVRLTPVGGVLLDEARAVLDRVERLQTAVGAARETSSTTVRTGVSAEVSAATLAAVVARLGGEHPDVRLEPVELPATEQVRALLDRRIDLGLVRRPVPAPLRHGEALVAPLGALLAQTDPLADEERIELRELGGARPVVLPPRASDPGHHDALLRTCHAYGYAPGEVLAAEGADFAAGLVLTRGAVALVEAPTPSPGGTVWRPVAGDPLSAVSAVAWHADDRRPAVALVARVLGDALLSSGRWSRGVRPERSSQRTPRPADAF